MIQDPELALGAARQLGAMIDRAADERLRLLRMVKDYQDRLDAIPDPVSADHIHRLMDAVRGLQSAIDQRMAMLDQLDQRIDHRLDQMARLEASMSALCRQMAEQTREVAGFKALADSAKRQVRAAAAAACAEPGSVTLRPAAAAQAPAATSPARLLAARNTDTAGLRALAARLNAKTG